MVSQERPRRPRPPAASRDRLLAAAVQEFAARGFDGAKVDRIAARARLNKAMLYYHFRSKADLYRAILLHLFSSMADAVIQAGDAMAAPDDQIRTFIRTMARQLAAHPHHPALWLREMAEGGRHVDASIVSELRRVLEVLAAILQNGAQRGVFRPAQPLVTQMAIVGPLLLFTASAPARERFGRMVPGFAPGAVPVEAVVEHIETATLAALMSTADAVRPATHPLRRTRS